MGRELLYAAIGTGFTCFMTALGASMVLFFKNPLSRELQRLFLGFAAGVMIAASVWSLLIPAMDQLTERGQNPLWTVGGGFIAGGLFLLLLDRLLPHLHMGSNHTEGLPSGFRRTTMVVLAVTLHNIPEGMAVGITFAVAASSGEEGALMAAVALAVGMGLQNFPEGAAVSLPLRSEGMKRGKAFLLGALSGLVELVFGLLTVLVASQITGVLPLILSFAAGAMIYVVVEELIPEANLGEHSHMGTVSVMTGFLVMMMLDVMLG